jgi:collagenase-like PrtC family protease
MKFSVGYQMAEDGTERAFSDIVEEFKEHISEMYFPWPETATCRASISERRGYVNWRARETLEEELCKVRDLGVKLDLLFNANCHGGDSVSQYLENKITSIIEHLDECGLRPEIVTTTSPAIARIVRKNFSGIEIRASVNMIIGTVKGMAYYGGLFDSFHIQRDYNRDFERIAELKEWADANGKKLIMLANSGCMSFCSGQIFHDNLVAHEREIDERKNIDGFNPFLCREVLKKRENWVTILQNTWVRPEDLHHYDKWFDTVKLATRMHANPAMVIRAYVSRKFRGNLADLCEPGYSPLIAPYVLDNTAFPDDWFEKTSSCRKKCHKCSYCQSVLEKVLRKME